MTLTDLQTKRDNVLAGIADANRRLQSGEDSIEKRDIDQLEKALAIIDREIKALNMASAPRTILTQFSRG